MKDEDEILYKKIPKNPKKIIKSDKPKNNTKQKTTKDTKSEVELVLFTVNANGMKKKEHSLISTIKQIKAGLFTIQETNYTKKGKLKVDEYDNYEAIRKKEGGGTLIGVHKTLYPILIEEISDEIELLVVEVKVEEKRIRVISGYGPQECWPLEQRMKFFRAAGGGGGEGRVGRQVRGHLPRRQL